MKSLDLTALTKALAKNKYVLLILCAGLLLLLLPRRSGAAAGTGTAAPAQKTAQGDPLAASGIPLGEESERLAALLGTIRGVGEAEVLLSERGCVVVCRGADSPAVRLSVISAVAAYTGLGSDRVSVYPMGEPLPQRVVARR